MTWIAPDVTRVDEPIAGDERATLEGLLDWHRATLLWKCSGRPRAARAPGRAGPRPGGPRPVRR
jgi:hypothetical protein